MPCAFPICVTSWRICTRQRRKSSRSRGVGVFRVASQSPNGPKVSLPYCSTTKALCTKFSSSVAARGDITPYSNISATSSAVSDGDIVAFLNCTVFSFAAHVLGTPERTHNFSKRRPLWSEMHIVTTYGMQSSVAMTPQEGAQIMSLSLDGDRELSISKQRFFLSLQALGLYFRRRHDFNGINVFAVKQSHRCK